MSENMIQCENLVKIYKTKDLEVMALQGRLKKESLLQLSETAEAVNLPF